jgi:16S rRNA (guanine527-N7)-methyltransferase
MMMDEYLLSVLQLAQDAGVIGRTDISEEISRARVFVAGLSSYPSDTAVLDIGSGGGLPGLVIAHDRPDVHVTLIDRRQKRTDLLQRQATRLRRHQPGHPIEVICADVRTLQGERTFDVITARSFGSPEVVVETAFPLLTSMGRLLVSEPPHSDGNRWRQALLINMSASVELFSQDLGTIAVITR